MPVGSSLAGILGSAGGGNFVGGSIVRLLLDANQFQSGLKGSEAQLHSFGRRVHSVGSGMSKFGTAWTRNVSVPLIAGAAVAGKMAIDFETAFTRIRANSNLTDEEIDKLKKGVLDLAGKTGKAPQELAEGLYFLASAGLSANQVQETLTQSAKASAAGFGVVGDIARLTANVLNAYAKEGITAAQVTDTLAAAVREGTAEPDEFANAMGRILPIASKAKVGFDEVAASLASLSNIGLDVDEGTTAMRGLLQTMSTGGPQATEALKDIGLTFEDMRESLADKGLLETLRMLDERTNGNIDTMRKIIPNIRSITGLFGITEQKADKVNASFKRVTNSTGDLDKAFKTTKKDEGFQIQQLLAELRTEAIKLGQVLLPVIKDVIGGVKDAVKWFGDLPKPIRESIVKWAALAVVLGPVAKLLGSIVKMGGSAIGILSRIGKAPIPPVVPGAPIPPAVPGAGAAAGVGMLGAGLLTGAAVAGAGAIKTYTDAASGSAQAGDALRQFAIGTDELVESLEGADGVKAAIIRDIAEAAKEMSGGMGLFGRTGARFSAVMEGVEAGTKRQRRRIFELVDGFDKYNLEVDESTFQLANNLAQTGDLEGALKLLRGALEDGIQKQGGFKGKTDDAAHSLDIQAAKVAVLDRRVRGLPSHKQITVDVNLARAEAAFARLRWLMANAASSVVHTPGLAGVGGVSNGGSSKPPRQTQGVSRQVNVNVDARGSADPAAVKRAVYEGMEEARRAEARQSGWQPSLAT